MNNEALLRLLDDLLENHDAYGPSRPVTTAQVFFDSGYRRALTDIRDFVQPYTKVEARSLG